MVTTPTHGYVSDGSQSVMYSVLSNDSGVTDITSNIYDGEPFKVARKYGYPLVIISPPTFPSEPITQVSWDNSLSQEIVIRTKSQSVLRQLLDQIVRTIIENENTFISYNMVNPMINQPVESNDIYDDEKNQMKVVYGLSIEVFFDVFTSYYQS